MALPPVTSGLIGYWPFDTVNPPSPTYYTTPDLSGNDQDIILYGYGATTFQVLGRLRNAFSFDGNASSSYNSFGVGTLASNITGDFSVCLLVNPSPGNIGLFAPTWVYLSDQGSTGIELGWFPNYHLFSSYANNMYNALSTMVPINQWTFLCYLFTGGNCSLYINNALTDTIPHTIQYPITGTFYIGQAANNFFPGLIDEVIFYNRAITAGEVDTLYQWTQPFQKKVTWNVS
jgi:hypothetical protein